MFLTHYLPDDPYENQSIAVASLILGQNGIWGDLPKISTEGVAFFGKILGLYKQIRDDMTSTAMIRDGAVGGSPEVYEKILLHGICPKLLQPLVLICNPKQH